MRGKKAERHFLIDYVVTTHIIDPYHYFSFHLKMGFECKYVSFKKMKYLILPRWFRIR